MDNRASCFAVACQFGNLIVDQDFQAACLLLTSEARSLHPPEAMKAAVKEMISYATGPILQSQLIEAATVEDWPAKRPGDLAVIYLALTGAGFSEAVTLTLVEESSVILIRDLTWGRP